MRVALNCYPPGIPTGLGTLAKHMLVMLPFARVLSYPHPRFPDYRATMGREGGLTSLHDQLRDIDCVVALERPLPGTLFREAKILGKRTVLIVMHEWINPRCAWLPDTDLFVSPNQHCLNKLYSMGLVERTRKLWLPMDLSQLPFTLRDKVEKFVFSNGWGGVNDRKGWPEMRAALELMTKEEQGQATIHSQADYCVHSLYPNFNANSGSLPSSQEIYEGMDVALVPSRCEGLGYSILEPMALGLPVLTTDSPPMSEYIKAAYGKAADLLLMLPDSEFKAPVWGYDVKYVKVSPAQIRGAIQFMKDAPTPAIQELSMRGRAWIEANMGACAAELLWKEVCRV